MKLVLRNPRILNMNKSTLYLTTRMQVLNRKLLRNNRINEGEVKQNTLNLS
jgi:hypothetical protein